MNRTAIATVLGLSLAACASSAALAQASILPQKPWLEAASAGPSANFDILVTNPARVPMQIGELRVFVLDRSGATVLERRVDGNGVAPSITVLAAGSIAPGQSKLIFNPFPILPADIHAAGVRIEAVLESEDDTPSVTVEAEATLRTPPAPSQALILPVAGRVHVWDGHDLLSHHRRWDYHHPALVSFGFVSNAMRYSYDFVRVDEQGRRAIGDPKRNENHLSFGLPVRSPAAGTVLGIENGQTDDGKFDPSTFKDRPNLVLGNHVIIRHADGLYSALGHLKQGSVTVKVGDVVKAGQSVAAIGNSGSSMFPHLHYQLMDGPTFAAEGVPSAFKGLTRLRGARRSPVSAIDSGDLVEAR